MTPTQAVNAEKKTAVEALFPLLDAVIEGIDGLDPELFYGGLPNALLQVRMQMDGAKSNIARTFDIDTTA